MEKKEIVAHAITHAPKGVKGGPYEGPCGIGRPVPTLAEAWRKRTRATVRRWLRAVRAVVPHARVIRIVRARPSQQPSEASAVEVLRELVADAPYISVERLVKARAILAASGPDAMPVVRAAMRETEAEEALRASVAARNNVPGMGTGPTWQAAVDAWLAASQRLNAARAERVAAVDAYRKAGGK